MLEAHINQIVSKKAEATMIVQSWGTNWQTAIPEDISPPWYTDNLLKLLKRISCLSTLDDVLPLL